MKEALQVVLLLFLVLGGLAAIPVFGTVLGAGLAVIALFLLVKAARELEEEEVDKQ